MDPFDFLDAVRTESHGPYEQAPFSLLDARRGPWKRRKRYWLDKGLKGELGRAEGLLRGMSSVGEHTLYGVSGGTGLRGEYSTSIFDPVLTEVLYRWFCPPGGKILDPFAGGAVRGIVAATMGRAYVGIDLRREQVEANREQADEIGVTTTEWVEGDALEVSSLVKGPFDFVFSCPPYWSLEVYSDDPRDLSTLDYPTFVSKYRAIVKKTVSLLSPHSFACFVVGEVRDPRTGEYVGFVPDTIRAFQDAGVAFYNDLVYVYPDGSLPLRAGRSLRSTRKISKMHQNVLVFLKGDAKVATARMEAPTQ